MDDYKYRLQYIDKDYMATVEFDADIDLESLRDKLKYFLSACSWTSSQVNNLLGEDY